jgi:PAS domain S-box-containing protein
MASVLLVVAIISGTLFYWLNKAFESQFLARARAEKHLAEECIKDKLQAIDKRLQEIANNNTVKITLMLGVKPQLREILREICPPADGTHFFVQGGPDNECYPGTPKNLVRLIQTNGSHHFEVNPLLLPDQWTLIFAQPVKRHGKTVGTAYCIYDLSQDLSLVTQLQKIGNNWFYFQVPGGMQKLHSFFSEPMPSRHPLLTNHDDFKPYTWGTITGITSRSFLFDSLYYFVPTQPLADLQAKMLYVIGGLSLLVAGLTQPFATLLTRRLSAPLKKMAAEARAISQGEKNDGFDLSGKQFAEFQQLSETFNSMLQQLHEAQEDSRYKELFDHVSDVMWIQDLEGNILETNEFCSQVLGYSRAELLGLKNHAICYPNDPAQVRKTLEEQGEAIYKEYRQDRYGKKIPFEVKARRIVYKDADCILTVARDITTLREAEEFIKKQNLLLEEMVAKRTDDLSQALVELEKAKQAAVNANISKSQFLANMSHEIRTPINGVLGIIDLLSYTELTEKQRQLLENARNSGEMLLIIINDILDLSRIEASKLVLEEIPFDLSKLVADVLELTKKEANEKGLEMLCLIHPETPVKLLGDPTRVRQILLNLLSNAIKFTAAGEIIVRVNCFQEHADRAEIRVEVQDSGIGMAPEVQSQIFDPFRQGDGSMTRKFGGTGLGLAIVKHLVTAMLGEVGVVSQLSQGSTFWFSIPFKKDASPQPGTVAPGDDFPESLSRSAGAPRVFFPARILLAEDNLVNREVALAMLTQLGCLVDVVSDGRKALEALAHNQYDLVFMDCQMPEIDGYEATRAIRAEESRSTSASRLPIIALTAHAMDGDRDLCLAAGMDDYLTKPFKTEQLQEILDRWLLQRDNLTEARI